MNYIDHYKYSPFTGNKLRKIDSQCLEDSITGEKFYINGKPTAIAIIMVEREVLLVKRAYDPHKGTWDLPGGFTNMGETFEDCIKRELKEELGLIVDTPIEYFGSSTNDYEYQGIVYPTADVVFTLKIEEIPKLVASDDVASYKLFSIDEIPFEQIKFNGINEILKQFANRYGD